jgi:hypothetical protein
MYVYTFLDMKRFFLTLFVFTGLLGSAAAQAYQNVDAKKFKELIAAGYSGDADPPFPVMLTPCKDYGSENLND